MSNEIDLDWLARNVHVWPYGMREVFVRYPRNVDTLIWSCVLSNTGWITKEQWLSRREELQNKPSWDKAEDWAEWLAQDQDGEWKWLAGLPGKYVDGWTAVKIKGCCKELALGDWRDTLEKRPEEFQPFTSIEDNQELPMSKQQETQQDNGWFERGELPPVGVECEFHGGARVGREWPDSLKDGAKVKVLCHYTPCMRPVAVFSFDIPGGKLTSQALEACFRPICTERDDLVDVLTKAGISSYAHLVADAILAAGYRKESK